VSRKQFLDQELTTPEFELVTQALWTDPNDQSGWLYHRWLIGAAPPEDVLRREVKNIRELHETEPDSNCKVTHPWKRRA
jgi:hypothetical protein